MCRKVYLTSNVLSMQDGSLKRETLISKDQECIIRHRSLFEEKNIEINNQSIL